MKRIVTCMLALLLLASLCACGSTPAKTTPTPTEFPAAETDPIPESTQLPDIEESPTEVADVHMQGAADVALRYCRFSKVLHASDGEYIGTFHEERQGKLFVDLALSVVNNTSTITENDFSGYLFYGDRRYDLQYDVERSTCTSFASSNDGIPTGQGAQVHLFALLPAEAANETSLEVYYSVFGQETSTTVAAEDTSDPLSRKTQLMVGQATACNNCDITVELMECSFKNYMTAQDKVNSEQYGFGVLFGGEGEPFAECVLKITNNSPVEIDINNILGYAITDAGISQTQDYIETKNNTALESFGSIVPGATEIIHLATTAITESDSKDVKIIRFNLAGSTFYCRVEE